MPSINQYKYEIQGKETKKVSIYAATEKIADRLVKDFIEIKQEEYRITGYELKEVITEQGSIAIPWATMEPAEALERQKEILSAMRDKKSKRG